MTQTTTRIEQFRQINPGDEPLFVDFSDAMEDVASSYVAQANTFNRRFAEKLQKYIHVSVDYDSKQLAIVCTTYEEYVLEKQRKLPRRWWKPDFSAKKKSSPTSLRQTADAV